MSVVGLMNVNAQMSNEERNSAEPVKLSEILPMPYPADNSGSIAYSIKPNETKVLSLSMRMGMLNLQLSFPSSLERTEKNVEWALYTDGGVVVDQGTDASKIESVNVYRHKTPAGKVIDLSTKTQPSTYYLALKCASSKPCDNTVVIRQSKNKLEMPTYTENMIGDGPEL